jgi:D-glycero-D-manno-heptose 1,7-bisphosphate phosphatase
MTITRERRLLLANACPAPQPALFLDRDGVIIEDRHHICDPDEVILCKGASELIRYVAELGWPVVIVTNQSGIARGLFSWADYERVTERMLSLLGPEAPIAAIYANGHGPDAPPGSWRKPSPAMLLDAATSLRIDLHRSLLIGDRLNDLKAGVAAGLTAVCHVLTGHGEQERHEVQIWSEQRPAGEVVMLANLEGFPCDLLGPRQHAPT